MEGDNEIEGLTEGLKLGLRDGLKLGLIDGDNDTDGLTLGDKLGDSDGDKLTLGDKLGLKLGLTLTLGDTDGLIDGLRLGESDGLKEALGLTDGDMLGDSEGLIEGDNDEIATLLIVMSISLLVGSSETSKEMPDPSIKLIRLRLKSVPVEFFLTIVPLTLDSLPILVILCSYILIAGFKNSDISSS